MGKRLHRVEGQTAAGEERPLRNRRQKEGTEAGQTGLTWPGLNRAKAAVRENREATTGENESKKIRRQKGRAMTRSKRSPKRKRTEYARAPAKQAGQKGVTNERGAAGKGSTYKREG